MPTYEYKCDACGYEFEAFQSISEAPIDICPVCNEHVHRVINGGAGLIFKGSGFYITDYKHAHSSGGGNGNGKAKHVPKDAAKTKDDSKKDDSKDAPSTKDE